MDLEAQANKMIKLRWYQEKSAPLIFDYWRQNPDKHPVIAVPTGGGKSIMIADLIHKAVDKWDIDVLVLSHRKEILDQNAKALESYLDQLGCDIDVGIYSAGLGQRNVGKVTIAGIQSVHKKAALFKNVKLVIIDEAHLIPARKNNETMYVKFINELGAKCVGFTATPYRLGTGYIIGDGHIFDDIIFDLTSKENFNKLVKQGYLTNLISKRTQTELDVNGIKTIAGDYSEKEMSLRFDQDSITDQAILEVIKAGKNYKKWLIFAIDIKHAEHIAEALEKHGVVAMPVHSQMEMSRDPILKAYKEGKIQALVNVNILTTGIDVPDIDLIVFLRPTKSPSLYVQSAGRGLRVAPGKDHCLVLDFARVVSTLGPINDVHVHKRKKGKAGEPIMKTCPECNSLIAPAVRFCPDCGFKFEFKHGISNMSGDKSIIANDDKLWYTVTQVIYNLIDNGKSPRYMRATYLCGIKTFQEPVCVEHKGWAKNVANHWVKVRTLNGVAFTDELNNAEKMTKIAKGVFREPLSIMVKEGKKYPEIVDYKF